MIVQVPRISWPGPTTAQLIRVGLAELTAALADRLVVDDHHALSEQKGKSMKIITLEEHFQTKEISDATRRFAEQFIAPQDRSATASTPLDILSFDLGEGRLRQMDAMGVDVQILSTAGVQSLPAAEAISLARDANDQLAAAIKAHPDRLAGFATLPTPDPEAAAAELERAVR